jgi:hypothetical protein
MVFLWLPKLLEFKTNEKNFMAAYGYTIHHMYDAVYTHTYIHTYIPFYYSSHLCKMERKKKQRKGKKWLAFVYEGLLVSSEWGTN